MIPQRRKYIKFFMLIVIATVLVIIFNLIKFNKDEKIIKKMIEKARYLAINENTNGVTYYISANGFSEEGTSVDNPMSLETANKKTFNGNDKILFKRGDTFYGIINFNIKNTDEDNMCYIGAYGEENLEKPIISGARILTNKDAWEIVDNNIYKVDLTNDNYFEGFKWSNGNIGFLEDELGNIYGNKKSSLDKLINDFDFYSEENYLYVKCNNNPTDILGKIMFMARNDLVKLTSYTVLENICVTNTGAHGIVKKYVIGNNIYINNCVISNIGGSYISGTTRYGNGIEFWLHGQNTIVTNCIIRNTYDAGYTLQGNDTGNNGFANNICQKNIFINCSYAFEFFAAKNSDITNTQFENNKVIDNIVINQGKGWGYDGRWQPANVVISTLPLTNNGLQYNNNRIYNSRMLYFRNTIGDKDVYNITVNSDNNIYYYNKDTIFFGDNNLYKQREYLSNYKLDENSIFYSINDNEEKIISNQDILNSNNYDKILEYYNNFDEMYGCREELTKIVNKIESIKNNEKYANITNNANVSDYIEKILKDLQESIIDQEKIVNIYNNTYELISVILEELEVNNIQQFNDFELQIILNDIDDLNEDFEKIFCYFNIEDDISSNTVGKELNKNILIYNDNLKLMNNVQKILLEARDLYQNNIQNNEKYKNYLNKLRIINLCNISNKLSQYNINLENEKSKVSVVYDSDKNKITTKDVTVRIVHGDNTKIINNNEKNTYTFTQNGSFTFRLSIKGKTHALAVSVKNIKETNVIDLNKKEYKSSIIQLVNEKDSGFISLRNNDFILIIIIIFIITAIITFIKYKRIFR